MYRIKQTRINEVRLHSTPMRGGGGCHVDLTRLFLYPFRPPVRPSSGKHRPHSAQSRPLSASGSAAAPHPSGETSDQPATQRTARLTKSLQATLTTSTSSTTATTPTPTSGSSSAPVTTVTASVKSLTARGKPPPRRSRRRLVVSDDDDDDDDDDDGDDDDSDDTI